MKYILFTLFLFATSFLQSSPMPYSDTGTYAIAQSIEPGIALPIADFELKKCEVNRTGCQDLFVHVLFPQLKFRIYNDVFTYPVALENYADWFTSDITDFSVLSRRIVNGGKWGEIPVYHQVLSNHEGIIHQLFVVRGYVGMGVCIKVPRGSSYELENFWEKVVDDTIRNVSYTLAVY